MVKRQLSKLNPNTDIPIPKTVAIMKAAVDLIEFDEAREKARAEGKEIQNLDEPADPVNLSCANNQEFPTYYYQGGSKMYRKTGLPKKRHR